MRGTATTASGRSTTTGYDQAIALPGVLAGRGISRVVSSPYLRCIESVEPLAAALGLTVELDGRLAEGAGGAGALALLAEIDGGLACTHGDIVEAVLGRVLEKGAAVVVELDGSGARVLEEPEYRERSARRSMARPRSVSLTVDALASDAFDAYQPVDECVFPGGQPRTMAVPRVDRLVVRSRPHGEPGQKLDRWSRRRRSDLDVTLVDHEPIVRAGARPGPASEALA